MGAYTILRDYTAVRDGRRFGPWSRGSEVDLEAPDAEWVNRDSPGALEPAKPAADDESATDATDAAPAAESPKAKASGRRGGKARE